MFSSAPAIVSWPATSDPTTETKAISHCAPTNTASEMDASKTDTIQDPNVWIPPKIERSTTDKHPTLKHKVRPPDAV
jgi:hypothetical protein